MELTLVIPTEFEKYKLKKKSYEKKDTERKDCDYNRSENMKKINE